MRILKRVFDIVFSLMVLILLSPIFLIVALLIRIKLGNPILFTQERVGKDNKIFKMYKFRSMTNERDSKGELLPNEKRLTRFGKKLRSLSIDELPEFINILKGDMSLIGPRPLLVRYLPLYNSEQIKRHHVLPGMSGWAQINGRNSISWEERFELDVWYVKNWNILLDIKIFFLTIFKVLKKEGINTKDDAIMEDFKGSTTENK